MGIVIGSHEGRRKPRRPRESTVFVTLIVAALVLVSAFFLYKGFSEYSEMKGMSFLWDDISEVARGGENISAAESGKPDMWLSTQPPAFDFFRDRIDFAALRAINPDVSGYIRIPGTSVDYPILRESSPKKYFYIDHNIRGDEDKYGSIFELSPAERGEDSGIDWIFGHHMSSGKMFTPLYAYEDEAFMRTPVYIYRDGYTSRNKVIGVCKIGQADPAYAFGKYPLGSDTYSELLSRLREESAPALPDSEWPDSGGSITILSTCYGRPGTTERVIVICREEERVEYSDKEDA